MTTLERYLESGGLHTQVQRYVLRNSLVDVPIGVQTYFYFRRGESTAQGLELVCINIDKIETSGGLGVMKGWIVELKSNQDRIVAIDQVLRECGV